jgi:hypothetical protein
VFKEDVMDDILDSIKCMDKRLGALRQLEYTTRSEHVTSGVKIAASTATSLWGEAGLFEYKLTIANVPRLFIYFYLFLITIIIIIIIICLILHSLALRSTHTERFSSSADVSPPSTEVRTPPLTSHRPPRTHTKLTVRQLATSTSRPSRAF